MNDSYAEWLVKRKTPGYAYIIMPVMIVACVISAFAALYLNVIGLIIATLVFGGTYLVFRNFRVEYEYIFVSGQFSFDKILGQSKRKRVVSCEMENVLIIAPEDSYLVKDQVNQNTKTRDFSSQNPDKKRYALVCQTGSERTKIIFEPNEKMMQCLKQVSPRKVTI